MAKIYLFLFLLFGSHSISWTQNEVRDKIAIMTNYICDDCGVSVESQKSMQAGVYAWHVVYLEKSKLFQIVNREDTEKSVESLGFYNKKYKNLDTKFWREYVEDLRIKGKGIGANFILIIDCLNFLNSDSEMKSFYRYKIIDVTNNGMATFSIEYENILNTSMSEEKMRKTIRESFEERKDKLSPFIDSFWNTTWTLLKAKGKNIEAGIYSMTPANNGIKVYWYQWIPHQIASTTYYEVNELGSSEITGLGKSSILLKTDKNLSGYDPKTLWGNLHQDYQLANATALTLSFLELPVSESENSLIHFDLNTKIYDAIANCRQFGLMQIEEKDIIYNEKDIQKGEEFLYGSSVSQTASRKSQYLLTGKDLGSTFSSYKVELRLISKSTGELLKSTTIESDPIKFENDVQNWLNSTMLFECQVESHNESEITLCSTMRLGMQPGTKCILMDFRKMDLEGESSNVRIKLADLKLIEQKGQVFFFKVDKIHDSGFKKIDPNSKYYFSYKID